jgi:hypothetical protein
MIKAITGNIKGVSGYGSGTFTGSNNGGTKPQI